MNKEIGLDIGYSAVKGVHGDGEITFPSLTGTGEEEIRMTGEATTFQILLDDKLYNVGDDAVEHSRFTNREESRYWYESIAYQVLLQAALSEMLHEGTHEAIVVTGLPVAFYEHDKDKLAQKIEQIHHINRKGSNVLTVNVSKCFVVPQPMGTLADVALDGDGKWQDGAIATGRIGVIDIGGKTTNLLHASELGAVDRETESVNLGGWNAVRAFAPKLEEYAPDAGYTDHEIQKMIIDGHVKYGGREVDLKLPLDEVLVPMAEQIVAKAKELWPGQGARLDTILLSGGGSALLADYIKAQIDHADIRVVPDGKFANARGYYKLAKYNSQQAQ
jgi:plasmid segregation protein ParM